MFGIIVVRLLRAVVEGCRHQSVVELVGTRRKDHRYNNTDGSDEHTGLRDMLGTGDTDTEVDDTAVDGFAS